MIDEVLEVQDYLAGKNISTRYMYHICFLLAKWFYRQGCESEPDIVDKIFEWAAQYNIELKCDVRAAVFQALSTDRPLRENIVIQINKNDVEEIDRRFGRKGTVVKKTGQKYKLVALAVLCWAKATADKNMEFSIPLGVMANWVGVDYVALRKKWLAGLKLAGYIKEINQDTATHPAHWNQYYMSRNLRFKILVPIDNEGEHKLQGNDIRGLFDEIYDNDDYNINYL